LIDKGKFRGGGFPCNYCAKKLSKLVHADGDGNLLG
jgi:hypothetical protein